jgi:outer membrane usher protein
MADIVLFESSQLSGANEEAAIAAQTPLGGFINYDVASSYSNNTMNSNAFLEGAMFNRWGVLENQFVISHLNTNERQFIRLNSTFTHDQLSQLTTLKLGDAVTTDINGLGGSVRFAGVQWGTNFNLQPNKVTFPLLSMQGEAVLPSTVDIFVNNTKSLSREVPIGLFTMDDLAVNTGKGEARMVITDILGREQVVTLPYYVSPNLLQVGLQEYNYELGVIRENYGIDNQNYGHVMAVLSHRIGIFEHITHEFSAQLLQQRQLLSYGGVFLWPQWGVLHSVMAGSWDHQRGTGHALTLSTEHQTAAFNWGVRATSQTRHFVNITTQDQGNTQPTQKLAQLFMSVPMVH